MKWSEMSKFQKIATIIGYVCAIVYVLLAVLDLTNVLPNADDTARIFFGIAWLSIGVQYWNRKKSMAIFYFILGVVNIVVSTISLLS